jgi:hypothetical protein
MKRESVQVHVDDVSKSDEEVMHVNGCDEARMCERARRRHKGS